MSLVIYRMREQIWWYYLLIIIVPSRSCRDSGRLQLGSFRCTYCESLLCQQRISSAQQNSKNNSHSIIRWELWYLSTVPFWYVFICCSYPCSVANSLRYLEFFSLLDFRLGSHMLIHLTCLSMLIHRHRNMERIPMANNIGGSCVFVCCTNGIMLCSYTGAKYDLWHQ